MAILFRRAPTTVAVGLLMNFFSVIFNVTLVEGRNEPHKYTTEELLSMHFENKESGDVGMDPCKSGKICPT